MHVTEEEIKRELLQITAAKKDPDHFGPLYDRYYKPIFVFIFKKVQDQDLTADICSMVFLKAMMNIKKYQFRGLPFSAWLFRIASNEVNMHFRSKKKVVKVQVDERDVKVLMEEMEAPGNTSEEELQVALETLGELPPDQSELIDMRFFEKLSFAEMGKQLGITEDNAKVRTYRVVKKLKTMITSKRG